MVYGDAHNVALAAAFWEMLTVECKLSEPHLAID